jgi:biotin carboxyl carrier protein
MTFAIEIGGRLRSVSVERAGSGRYRVVLDGRAGPPVLVDAVRVGESTLSLLVDGGAASHEVQLAPGSSPGELLAMLRGRTVAVGVNGRRRRRAAGDAAAGGHGEAAIVAPMPGRIVRVLVGAGDAVIARQPLVVVEAMKMENEVRSPRGGTVKDVTVSAGMSVDAGRVLVTVV